jgi:hypothetical protein
LEGDFAHIIEQKIPFHSVVIGSDLVCVEKLQQSSSVVRFRCNTIVDANAPTTTTTTTTTTTSSSHLYDQTSGRQAAGALWTLLYGHTYVDATLCLGADGRYSSSTRRHVIALPSPFDTSIGLSAARIATLSLLSLSFCIGLLCTRVCFARRQRALLPDR